MHPSAVLLRTVRPAALCRDLDRLVVAAGDLGTPVDVGPLRRWWTHVARIVGHDLTRLTTEDAAEHQRLQDAFERVASVLATLDGEPPAGRVYPDVDLSAAAMQLRSLVRRRLGDGLRTAGAPLLLGTSRSEVAFEVPWLLDGLDDDRAASVLAALPRATRTAPRLAHATWYRWLTAPVRTPVERSRCLGARQAATA
jgi:hypothetical protein